jgi:hypothetical protein
VLVRASVALSLASAVVVAAASAGPSAFPYCSGTQLKGHWGESSGAAGTIIVTAILKNTGAGTCAVRGYPALQLIAPSGRKQHTVVTRGGLEPLDLPVKTVVLRPGRSATVRIAYSDVPHDNETRCPESRALLVTPPAAGGAVRIGNAPIAACGHGHLRESPLLAGVRGAA